MDFIKGQRRETERKGQYKILWGVLAEERQKEKDSIKSSGECWRWEF